MPATLLAQETVAVQAEQARAYHAGRRSVGETYDLETGSWRAPKVEAVDTVAARIEAQEARAKAFRESPRGRFLAAIDAMERDCGLWADAERLRGIYNRELTTLNGPLTAKAVAGALIILDGPDLSRMPFAREARVALQELLLAEVG